MTEGDPKATGTVGMTIDQLFGKSEYSKLNNPDGLINNSQVDSDAFNHTHEFGRGVKFFNLFSKTVESVFAKNTLSSVGPYYGIVLRIDSRDTIKQNSEESDLDRILNNTDDSSSFVIRVRIPAIHKHIPIPKLVVQPSYQESNFDNLGKSSAPCRLREKIDNDIIDLHPQFSGKVGKNAVPEIGSVVLVDFKNRKKQSGGFFIEPVSDKLASETVKIYNIAFSAFQSLEPEKNIADKPKGTFNSSSPVVNDFNQVAKPKPIKKPKNASTQVTLGDWGDVL